jgi:hypothetical protein
MGLQACSHFTRQLLLCELPDTHPAKSSMFPRTRWPCLAVMRVILLLQLQCMSDPSRQGRMRALLTHSLSQQPVWVARATPTQQGDVCAYRCVKTTMASRAAKY